MSENRKGDFLTHIVCVCMYASNQVSNVT